MNDIEEKLHSELLQANLEQRSILSKEELDFISPYIFSFMGRFGGDFYVLLGFAVVLFRLGMLYSKRYLEPIRISINERN